MLGIVWLRKAKKEARKRAVIVRLFVLYSPGETSQEGSWNFFRHSQMNIVGSVFGPGALFCTAHPLTVENRRAYNTGQRAFQEVQLCTLEPPPTPPHPSHTSSMSCTQRVRTAAGSSTFRRPPCTTMAPLAATVRNVELRCLKPTWRTRRRISSGFPTGHLSCAHLAVRVWRAAHSWVVD